ncbi:MULTISPECIES: hypothetical protein [Streptomyces]|uniref:hypothetical protein n=1 Tax=Streptomyces TaxID=1883 RepID=UPI00081DD626|nr:MULTISPECIES: hypothetical protein [unclassified Streptomyces]MYV44811.1 hypothetical protein [Streptomyces sp. SID2888]MYZ38125.1 hypothetical protein [Streptomyces sp. SID4917]SCF96477.1 hypothetical protein GA0115259_105838 [Streptomyces sp. MnatMP-M17]SED58732.1 hypothetical protein SAMN05216533_0030 [Streptomyces sp. Ag109_O5-10]SEF17773.1 hypothetical protein SAMN05216533_8515 [Streptomyces sp. Ag109_O5-10]
MAESTAAPGFAHDILPLFRSIDIEHMAKGGVQLDQYVYMSVRENAERVYNTVATKRMPPPDENATWSEEQVALLRAWIDGGMLP